MESGTSLKVILYKISCGRPGVTERKLIEKGIPFETICDEDEIFRNKNIEFFPTLEVDGKILDFKEAQDWVEGYDVE